jgi:hypothetical protein
MAKKRIQTGISETTCDESIVRMEARRKKHNIRTNVVYVLWI